MKTLDSVIIINYKMQKLTIDYVNNELSKLYDDLNIIIVNNEATPESNKELQDNLDATIIIDNELRMSSTNRYIIPSQENLGFARGNNLGARFAIDILHSKYLLFSNNDIKIHTPDTFSKLKEKLESNSDIGLIGPKIIGLDGKPQSPAPYIPFLTKYVLMYISTPFLTKKKKQEIFKLNYAIKAKEGAHYKIMGSFMMIRAQDYLNCGMMDPNTFLYSEEVILSERLKRINKIVYYFPAVTVTHAHGITTKQTTRQSFLNNIQLKSDQYYYKTYTNTPTWEIKFGSLFYKIICKLKTLKY